MNKKNKRKLTAITLLGAGALLVLSGCGQQSNNQAVNQTGGKSEKPLAIDNEKVIKDNLKSYYTLLGERKFGDAYDKYVFQNSNVTKQNYVDAVSQKGILTKGLKDISFNYVTVNGDSADVSATLTWDEIPSVLSDNGTYVGSKSLTMKRIGNDWKLELVGDAAISDSQSDANKKIVESNIGDDIVGKTIKIKVTSSEEKDSLGGTPASENTKFVVVSLETTNLTNEEFTFYPDDYLKFVDDKGREFNTYDEHISIVDNNLDMEDLAPSIVKKGVMVYEMPNDSQHYLLQISEENQDTAYRVSLK